MVYEDDKKIKFWTTGYLPYNLDDEHNYPVEWMHVAFSYKGKTI